TACWGEVPRGSRRRGGRWGGGDGERWGPPPDRGRRAALADGGREREAGAGKLGLVLHRATVGLGGRGIGLGSGLLGVQALPHEVHALHLGLAAAGIVVDGAVVGELALRVDDEH